MKTVALILVSKPDMYLGPCQTPKMDTLQYMTRILDMPLG